MQIAIKFSTGREIQLTPDELLELKTKLFDLLSKKPDSAPYMPYMPYYPIYYQDYQVDTAKMQAEVDIAKMQTEVDIAKMQAEALKGTK